MAPHTVHTHTEHRIMSCCNHQHHHELHGHSHGGGGDELDEDYMANDPTLSSCCERDRRDYQKAMKLKATLTAHDPTSGGVRFRQQLFQPPPTSATPAAVSGTLSASALAHSMASLQVEEEDDDSDFDSDDDDFGMAELLAARRKEMERQMQQAAQDVANGFGIVQTVSVDAFTRQVREEREVPKVALFLGVDGERHMSFQHEMATVAKRFIGTRFFSIQVPVIDNEAAHQLRLRRLPCVAAFRDGERVDAMAIEESALGSADGAQVLWETTLLPWLTVCGVLSTERRQPKRQSNSSTALSGDADDQEEEERRGFDCGMDNCRLRFTYKHEHVGSSKEVKDEISAWRQATTSH